MPIAPITGKLRKRFFIDLSCAFGLGIAAGYAYWYGSHLPALEKQENYYVKLEREKVQQAQSA
ncbi:cytochrome-c oxidase, subunit VIIa [Macrolepiota fuliginosa MF-IS2]|uniref:Cytochrome c oxidase subunit 9, mitochondrial n=1 Tax=Macrolepiota fuliginosa MF-IS2 TaxID=1400762 RepID=A0A9P6C9T3_9AGAR|nr:cytochrome-c oxidase, subunit VIIa [Macrolepiota fuliginosa MF-IS2]